MERARPEELRVYRNLIENLESLKHREGTTMGELSSLVEIQRNLTSLASLAGDMTGFQQPGPDASRSFRLGLAL